MARILILRCSRCGKPYDSDDSDWFVNAFGDDCHRCVDGVIGEVARIPQDEPPPKLQPPKATFTSKPAPEMMVTLAEGVFAVSSTSEELVAAKADAQLRAMTEQANLAGLDAIADAFKARATFKEAKAIGEQMAHSMMAKMLASPDLMLEGHGCSAPLFAKRGQGGEAKKGHGRPPGEDRARAVLPRQINSEWFPTCPVKANL